jgi:xanthine dehydrogenase/oxidase
MPSPHPQPVRGGPTPTTVSAYARDLVFFLNGEHVQLTDVSPATLLVDYLRSNQVGLTGTKIGCKQGGCGACTVLLSRYDSAAGQVVHRSINACLRPLASLDGMAITTVEGISCDTTAARSLDRPETATPPQYCLAKNNGTQCGYCTPGWIMSAHGLLAARGIGELRMEMGKDRVDETDPCFALLPTKQELQERFDGNLCRCTGYRPILHGFQKGFAKDWVEADDKDCMACQIDPAEVVEVSKQISPPFPAALKIAPRAVAYADDRYQWFRPVSLGDLKTLFADLSPETECRFVVGNTSIGIYDKYVEDPPVLIDVAHIPELTITSVDDAGLEVGAGVTYNDFIALLDAQIAVAQKDYPPRLAGLNALHYLARRTAGAIVRDAASLGGNTMLVLRHITAGTPFPSDLFTALASVDATVRVWNPDSGAIETHPLLDYAALYAGAPEAWARCLLLGYRIPFTTSRTFAETYKTALREVNSHTIVNAGFRIVFDAQQRVAIASLVVGGIAPVATRLARAERAMAGGTWDWPLFRAVAAALKEDLDQLFTRYADRYKDLAWEGFTEDYKRLLAHSFLYKFFLKVALTVNPAIVPAGASSAADRAARPVSRGTQTYCTYEDEYPLNAPFVKIEALIQANGSAKYPQDLALPALGLEAAYVVSTRVNATFSYHLPGLTRALPARPADVLAHLQAKFPGVVDYMTCEDLLNRNTWGMANDQPLFAEGTVSTHGQAIGLVLATNEQVARDAAHHVGTCLVSYADLPGTFLTIQDAIKVDPPHIFADNPESARWYSHVWKLIRPGSSAGWFENPGPKITLSNTACRTVNGKQEAGSQLHFYMETQTCLAIPEEDGQMLLRASTQDSAQVQSKVANLLGVPLNKVDVRVARIGGGYGGKCSQPTFVALAAAAAARKWNRPVRLAVPRDIDSAMFGHRHPALGEFVVAIGDGSDDPKNRGRLLGLQHNMWLNGGWTYDVSLVVADCLQLRADSAYFIQHYGTQCDVCKTNTASNTAFRTMGMIQGVILQEETIEKAAHAIGMRPEDVRAKNLYQPQQATPFGQVLDDCYMQDVFDYTRKTYEFDQRWQAVNAFNAANRHRKRGISLIPVKYGSGFNLPLLEQAGALVEIFDEDGSVLVRTGGIEMGQGLATKMAQAAAYYLGIPMTLIRVAELDTSVVPHPTSTGASTGSTFNAEAVRAACEILMARLKEYCRIKHLPHPTGASRQWDPPPPEGSPPPPADAPKKKPNWQSAVGAAESDAINLSAQVRVPIEGGEALDAEGFVFHDGGTSANPTNNDEQNYHFTGYTYSAAISEVEVDVLTGETTVLRSDIVYDMGRSQNPAVDVGQIEGAFVQGIGYVMYEDLVYQPDGPQRGVLNSTNTWTYKPPAVTSIPLQMNVDLYKYPGGDDDPLRSSKEVGEPPMTLAATVFFAIKHAILAARKDQGDENWFELAAPATVQRVALACHVGDATKPMKGIS